MENGKKHALVTGASSGIGYELAKVLAKEGYNLILVARSEENLQAAAKEIAQVNANIHTHIYPIDLFEADAPAKVYDWTREQNITVDVLVNDAGQGEYGRFVETALQREREIVQLNVVALMSLTKYYLKEMEARNEGKILQVASAVSKAPSPYMAVYAATKAFVLSLTEALQEEMKDTNVTITALRPDATDTDFFHKAGAEKSKIYKEGNMYTAEEVAQAGIEGLLNGDSVVIPGFMNKAKDAMNVMLPDSMVAKMMEKQMEPSEDNEGRTHSDHPASQRERESINEKKGTSNGDF